MKVSPARPPAAPVRPQILESNGDVRVDPYYWLRDRQNPEVTAYLETENAYTEAVMRASADTQQRLYREIVGRIQETDHSAPVFYKGWWTYTRTVEGLEYEIYCRRLGSMDAPEQVILDANELAKGHDYLEVGFADRSPDETLLAYAVDFNGAELHELRFRDLTSGADLPDFIGDVYYGAAWSADSKTFFYVKTDATVRPYQVWRHRLGGAGDDALVYQEDDERFEVSLELSKSERFIFITSASQVTSEVLYLTSDRPEATPASIEPRRDGIEYSVEHQEDRFLILTDDAAPNFRLMAAPISRPGRAEWSEIVPERPGVRLNSIDVHRRHVVLGERSDAMQRLEVLDTTTGELHVVAQPDASYTAYPGADPEYDSHVMRFFYTSLNAPWAAVDYDLITRERTVVKEQPVRGGYDRRDYETERQWATAPDGVRVPISLVYKRGLDKSGAHPALLYGYGAYEHSSDPMFDPARLSLLDRGFVFAIAHVRGGGEMGREWYEDGKFLRKRNTFSDFVACAEHLIAHGYTRADRLAIRGAAQGAF